MLKPIWLQVVPVRGVKPVLGLMYPPRKPCLPNPDAWWGTRRRATSCFFLVNSSMMSLWENMQSRAAGVQDFSHRCSPAPLSHRCYMQGRRCTGVCAARLLFPNYVWRLTLVAFLRGAFGGSTTRRHPHSFISVCKVGPEVVHSAGLRSAK